ncbi:MAG: alpha/beta fold hydrolase [Thermoguttaceae bacterium]|nr:alpha/beta fold hydrolase [Thermoguttaceae bacterium]
MSSWKELYPFESHFLTVNDGSGMPLRNVRMHYIDEGPKDAPVILFSHGNPTWSFLFRNLIIGLRNKYRCVAADGVGMGLSDKGACLAEYPFTLGRRADDLCSLIDELQLTDITLVAHDWGGPVGMCAAVRRQDKFKRFSFSNTSLFRKAKDKCPFWIGLARNPLIAKTAVQGMNMFCRAASKWCTEKPLPKEVKQGYMAPYDNWSNRRAVYEYVQDIPFKPGDRSWDALIESEQGMTIFKEYPVLLPWGMKDWCFSPEEYLGTFKEKFVNSTTLEFANAGHYVYEDEPDACLEALKSFMEK